MPRAPQGAPVCSRAPPSPGVDCLAILRALCCIVDSGLMIACVGSQSRVEACAQCTATKSRWDTSRVGSRRKRLRQGSETSALALSGSWLAAYTSLSVGPAEACWFLL
jgi:hypothetical protein